MAINPPFRSPEASTEIPSKSLPEIVTTPWVMARKPPWKSPAVAKAPKSTTDTSSSVMPVTVLALARMPPPSGVGWAETKHPFSKLKPSSVSAPAVTTTNRKTGSTVAASHVNDGSRWTTLPRPAVIVRSSVTSGRPAPTPSKTEDPGSAAVRVTSASRTMVSAPVSPAGQPPVTASVLAATMASGRVQVVPSAVIVAAKATPGAPSVSDNIER